MPFGNAKAAASAEQRMHPWFYSASSEPSAFNTVSE